MTGSKNWCFTLNNYTEVEVAHIEQVDCVYLVFGREVGENGTPHLQGYICFARRIGLASVKGLVSARAHFEPSRGTPLQASEYCKKDNAFFEKGTLPEPQGKRNDLQRAKEFIDDFVGDKGRIPSERELAQGIGTPYIRYRRGLFDYAKAICPAPILREGEPREWQRALAEELERPGDDRTVVFIVDTVGDTGKTWFQQWYCSKHSDKVQILGVGKRDDMAYAVDESKSIFFINVGRGQMEYLQYSVLEMLKDRLIFSNKYESTTKILRTNCHVVVFCNEAPDMEKLSADRYIIKEVN